MTWSRRDCSEARRLIRRGGEHHVEQAAAVGTSLAGARQSCGRQRASMRLRARTNAASPGGRTCTSHSAAGNITRKL